MKRLALIVAPFVVISGSGVSDSIRAGGVLYENVYIVTNGGYYHVHFPEEGRVERISQARRDVEKPLIEKDPAVRAALKQRFDERRAELDAALKETKSVTVELDVNEFHEREAIVDMAAFETQLEHWRGLSAPAQELIFREIMAQSLSKAASQIGAQVSIASRLDTLDEQQAEHEAAWARSQAKRDAAVEKAQEESLAGYYIREQKKTAVRRDLGYRTDLLEKINREGAETEMEFERRRTEAANELYGEEAKRHQAALAEVESEIARRERDALAVENKGRDAQRRVASQLARIDALILATRANHEPVLKYTELENWSKEGDFRSPTVTIEHAIWRVQCTPAGAAGHDDFVVTVYDAETNAAFTRIPGKDFLGARFRILDRPGKFYFTVEQEDGAGPFDLIISGVDVPE